MATPTEAPAPQPYHFVLTVQRSNGVASTRSDVLSLVPGTARSDVLNELARHYFPEGGFAVLFFDLQPNQI